MFVQRRCYQQALIEEMLTGQILLEQMLLELNAAMTKLLELMLICSTNVAKNICTKDVGNIYIFEELISIQQMLFYQMLLEKNVRTKMLLFEILEYQKLLQQILLE